MKNVIPAVSIMIAYAVAVTFIGGLTWFLATPGSNAVTALIVSGAAGIFMTLCAILSLRIQGNRRMGLVGLYGALVIPLIIAGGAGMRLRPSLEKAQAFNSAVRSQPISVSLESLRNDNSPQPVAYQSVGLGAITALSLFAFVALLAARTPLPPSQPAPVIIAPNPVPAQSRSTISTDEPLPTDRAV